VIKLPLVATPYMELDTYLFVPGYEPDLLRELLLHSYANHLLRIYDVANPSIFQFDMSS
jgi:hypothetical protein